jgi:PPE-repeat protein
MMAAAAAWDALATELYSAATGYGSVVSELTGEAWLGPASLAMANAAAPYVAWLHGTATQAAQTAAQAKAAAAAYELAFAMTVPPPVIAANRSLLAALVATNFFGQNSPAIAVAEAHYAEMWLQDATAMYGYAGSSATASQLAPFNQPPSTTDPAGLAGQSGAAAHAAAGTPTATHPTTLSQLLSTLASPPQAPPMASSSHPFLDILEHVPNVTNTTLSSSNAVTSGRGIYALNTRLDFQAAQEAEPAPEFAELPLPEAGLVGSASVPAVSGAMAKASLVGKLSVPPSWFTMAPEIQPVALAIPDLGTGVTSAASTGIPPVSPSVFSQSVLGALARHGADPPRAKSKPIIVRSPAAG